MRRAINLNEKFDMEHEILDLIDKYWKFDNDQTPVSNWHDKQDLLEAVRKVLRIHDIVERSEQLKAFAHFLKWKREGYISYSTEEEMVNDYKESL